jgi:hypothetical protein
MVVYTLRSSWRLTDGRGGAIVTSTTISAETTADAIAAAKREPEPNQPVRLQSMFLLDAAGRIVWSLSGPAARPR